MEKLGTDDDRVTDRRKYGSRGTLAKRAADMYPNGSRETSGYQTNSLRGGTASMKRFVLIIAAAALLITSVPHLGNASSPFDQRLSQEQQIIQALNRLTFGPRPGDVEQVRRMGVAKWIELQLHPDRIPENPELEAKLKPLETLRMDLPEIVKKYTPEQQPVIMMTQAMGGMNGLSPEERRKVLNGTAEQRKAVLSSMDDEKRKQVLAQIPLENLEGLPEYKKEADDARKMQQEERQKENRQRNPQLNDLLNPDQIKVARSGNKEQLTALFAFLDPDKRPLVASRLPAAEFGRPS